MHHAQRTDGTEVTTGPSRIDNDVVPSRPGRSREISNPGICREIRR